MPTLTQLKQALTIAEQIEKLQAQLSSLVGDGSVVASSPRIIATPAPRKGKRTMSAAARARIAAAQRARWAKVKGASAMPLKATAPTKKKKGGLSPEGRARIVAALKARWAAKKKAQK